MYNYTRVLCHFAALVLEFTDAWSEGDGERILRCWKIFMLHFHAERRTKYALEALRLQFQLATLSPDLVHQLTWGRFVNTHGGPGMNIPCDLYNEHVNKLFKEVVSNMGANFTEAASTRAARAVTSLAHMSERFDSESGIHPEASAHTTMSDEADVNDSCEGTTGERCVRGTQWTKPPQISQDFSQSTEVSRPEKTSPVDKGQSEGSKKVQ